MVDNPRLGITHTLKVLSLHALVLCGGIQLAILGCAEFYEWGQGPLAPFLLSSGGRDPSKDLGRGGAGFVFTLLFELVAMWADLWLSAAKYLANLRDLYKDPSSTVSVSRAADGVVFLRACCFS